MGGIAVVVYVLVVVWAYRQASDGQEVSQALLVATLGVVVFYTVETHLLRLETLHGRRLAEYPIRLQQAREVASYDPVLRYLGPTHTLTGGPSPLQERALVLENTGLPVHLMRISSWSDEAEYVVQEGKPIESPYWNIEDRDGNPVRQFIYIQPPPRRGPHSVLLALELDFENSLGHQRRVRYRVVGETFTVIETFTDDIQDARSTEFPHGYPRSN